MIYIIGCILSYARVNASMKELHEAFPELRGNTDDSMMIIMVFLSWIGFIAGIITYFTCNERKFMRWT